MRTPGKRVHLLALLGALLGAVACGPSEKSTGVGAAGDFPVQPGGGKTDVAGRRIIGVASPYPADPSLAARQNELDQRIDLRRETAWDIVARVLEPVPLVEPRLADDPAALPRIARWQTWYSKDDFSRMFKKLYRDLGTDGRKARAPFSDEALSSIFRWNATALDETPSWPLERYLDYVKGLDEQVDFDGVGGDFRIAYSPATMMHWLRNYRRVLECAKNKTQFEAGAEPVDAKNHAGCLDSEFPTDAALVKAQWFRSDFGMQLPSYDTTPESLQVRLGPDGSKQWGPGDSQADPDATKAHTVRLRNGSRYRLGALHIVTKELRHWVWITLWWSPQPDGGFGADRPESIRKLGGAWSNYNMCVVTDYTEGDEDPVGRFRDKYPQLSAALAAVQAGKGQPTWCSNGYVERGRGNANTNCIGCHQHAGTGARTRDIIDSEAFPHNGRTQLRQNFPGDYAWSFDRGDNISRFIFAEAQYYDSFEQ
ncbi:MAG: hypothetical protein KC503_41600 [Myxococcales bacterium]|nr:hypothetical protein [Myxococcales bacterium]